MSDTQIVLEDYERQVLDLVESMERFRSASGTLEDIGEALTDAARKFTDAYQEVERLADHASGLLLKMQQLNPEALHLAISDSSSALFNALDRLQHSTDEWRGAWEAAHQALEDHQEQQFQSLDHGIQATRDELRKSASALIQTQHEQTTRLGSVANHLSGLEQRLEGMTSQICGLNQQLEKIQGRIENTLSRLHETHQAAERAESASKQAAQNVVGMTHAMINEVSLPLSNHLKRMKTISFSLLVINAILSIVILAMLIRG